MRLKYFLNEISGLLDEATVAETGRVWDVYVYDEDSATHLCELTPSYDCYNVSFFTEKEISDELSSDFQTTLDDCYWPCRLVDKIGKDVPSLPLWWDDEEDEEYLERALDWCRGNCGMFERIPEEA